MSLFNTFGTDKALETSGVWIDFPANDDGTVPGFLITRMSSSNPEYQKALEKVSKKYKQDINLDLLSEEVAAPVFREVFVETILKDCRHIQDPKGQAIDYSRANMLQLMTDLPDLYAYLVDKAKSLATFRKTQLDAAVKK